LHKWKARREVSQHAGLDDFKLADIGVSRGDVEWAAHLPLTTDATVALEEKLTLRQRHAPTRRAGWGAY
jgi:hypothetical protein